MARKSSSFETLTKSQDQGLTKSTKSSIDNLPIEKFEQGEYILVPQEHFNVNTNYNGVARVSSRFAIVNLTNKYCRTIKISDLTGSISIVGDCPVDLKTEMIKKTKNDGSTVEVLRLIKGQLPSPVRACVKGQLPIITEGDKAKLITPCIIKVNGYISGSNVSYVEKEDHPGYWDLKLDNDGEVNFNNASLMQFEVEREIKDKDINAAISLIKADDQLSNLYVAL